MGFMEMIIIFAVIVLIFGAKKIPELGRAFGRATREFKKGLKDEEIDVTESSRRAQLRQTKEDGDKDKPQH